MSKSSPLSDFVRDALAKGAGRTVIENQLLAAGWSAGEVKTALAAWGDPTNVMPPVPRPIPSPSAREALFYTLKFLALLVVVWNIINIGFDQIESTFGPHAFRVSRWSIATLIVFAPVFVGLHIYTQRLVQRDAGTRRSNVRIWLGNTGLFFAALTILGVTTGLLGAWLNGALDQMLVLQMLLLAVVAGAVALFFRSELATPEPAPAQDGTA
ncbi:hypothetical protein BVG79_00222 [Ketogulonicigenium robustum]|uniref:DUF5671 domain-containing protein n=1 Tax=Ketogulonicigenium robustum TaxID=92947 RepID=A0A1W6NWI3_9RHOB|nr:DUF5671 domain-containing protein [Ketogulonicigenium robustum]ARO13582.1 hypothetical protein BVG79_00222 [Ketogulonicigenium robustum]